MRIPDQQKKPSSRKFEFIPVVTEALSKQLRFLLFLCSDLCGCVLAREDATVITAGSDVQQWISLKVPMEADFSSIVPSLDLHVLDPSACRTARCCSRSSSVCCYFIFSLLLAVTTRKREGMWKWQPARMKLQHVGLLWCQFLLYPPLPVVLTLCSLHHIGNARITLEIIVYQEPCSVGSIRLSPKDQCVLCWMNSRLATGARDVPCCFSSIIVPSSVWGTAPCAGEHGRLLLSHRECWRAGSVQNWWSAWWSDIKNSVQEPPCAAALSSGSTLPWDLHHQASPCCDSAVTAKFHVC